MTPTRKNKSWDHERIGGNVWFVLVLLWAIFITMEVWRLSEPPSAKPAPKQEAKKGLTMEQKVDYLYLEAKERKERADRQKAAFENFIAEMEQQTKRMKR